jgi:hypothetical protein
MRKFACGPISFPNDAAGLHCRAMRIPIGSKPGDNSSPKPAHVERIFYPYLIRVNPRFLKPMENVVSDLSQALRERLAIIGDEESRRDEQAHMARLHAISERIDKLAAALPRPIDPRLAHYLQRRSYDKALEFLEQL